MYLLIFCLMNSNSFADCLFRVRVSDYAPLYFQDKNGKWTGLDVELADALFNEMSCRSLYEIVPWKRSLMELKRGNLDMMMTLSITEERKKFLNFLGPIRDEIIALAVSDNSDYHINSLEDFKKFPGKIGIQMGSFYGDAFDTKYKNDKNFANKFYALANDKQNIYRLKANRIFGFFGDRYNLAYKIANDDAFKGIKIHPFFINQAFVYFGFSKKSVSKEMFNRIQKAFDQAKLKGKFEKILQKYR